MALTAAQLNRLQIAYAVATMTCAHYVQIPQADAQAILVLNNAGDTVAAAFSPSCPIIPTPAGY